jgi:hypothetical protein
MSDWREQITHKFIPNLHQLTLVADPDSLFSEEILVRSLEEKGFTLISYHDGISFRHVFERDYRVAWDAGLPINIVLIFHGDGSAMDLLPFDILSKGEKLSFDLSQLFPFLSRPILEHVEWAILDRLYDDKLCNKKKRLGDAATKDYILQYGYHINTDTVLDEISLLRLLIQLHYKGKHLPTILAERIVEYFQKKNLFSDWPLGEILSDARVFFDFLQEQWPLFLAQELESPGKE